MNYKACLLASTVAFSLFNSVSCSKKDKSEYSDTDPRISIVSIKGLNTRIIINDVEQSIYNLDSLAYGTDISNMSIFFYGYDANTSIEVFQNDTWVPYSNIYSDTTKFDLSNLKIRSTSVDKSNSIEYTVALRVHKFDVNSLTWEKVSTLPVVGEVKNAKAVSMNGIYYYLYENMAGDMYCLASKDAKTWESKAIKISDNSTNNYNWASLVAVGKWNDLWLPFVGNDYDGIVHYSNLPISGSGKDSITALYASVSRDLGCPNYILSEFGNNQFYGLSSDSLFKSDAETSFDIYKSVSALPKDFPTEDLVSLVVNSGAHTQIAYIYGYKGGVASLWALDAAGNLKQLGNSSTNANFPLVKDAAFANIDGEIALIGGVDVDGKYLNTFYTSADAGINWTDNWHKQIPGNIGRISKLSAISISDKEMLLLGGETEKGVSLDVWRARLNGK